MKKFRFILLGVVVLCTMVLSACGGGESQVNPGPAVEESTPVTPTGVDSPVVQVSIPGPVAGTTMLWVDGSVIAYVPEGEFNMGADGADNPIHTVGLSSFWIQQGEVTNRQYSLCVSNGQCSAPLDAKRALALEEPALAEVPVSGINWQQADAYCTWIQGSLPTEAQWEKTGRGPESRLFPWGDANPSCDLLNFDNCVGFPADSGQYPSGNSYYGVFDMAGNVFEWVHDWYDPAYYPVSPVQDPQGPEAGTLRGLRSSSYFSFSSDIALARRLYMEPEKFREDVGFRCVVQEPQIQLPFCQVSAIGVKQSAGGSSSLNCEPPKYEVGGSFCANDNSYVNIFVTSGELSSTDKSSLCHYGGEVNGESIFTCGPGKVDKVMSMCGECTNLPAPSELECPLGYTPLEGWICAWDGEGISLPVGEAPGCPDGWTSGNLDGNPNYPACADMSPKSAQGEYCPAGTYWDAAVPGCVGTPVTGATCMAGFVFDPQAGCCAAPSAGNYPGCGPGDYMNKLGFCSPMLIETESCTDVVVSYIDCEDFIVTPVPGGNDGGDPGSGGCNLTCTNGNVLDPVSCTCLGNKP